ncbi:MAG: PHB depolymerase family esterase [Flavobacteriales bacterium]
MAHLCRTLFFCWSILLVSPCFGQSLQEVTGFGSNPGNLRMYEYVPTPQPSNDAPLLVAMHGCTQDASAYFNDTEWYRLADRYGFYLVFPQQKSSNNSNDCFNWFLSSDQERGSGEPLSIRQMVGEMETNYSIDTDRTFLTGLSAGGAMSAVLMASYPDVFEGGAIMAGLPYKAATNSSQAFNAMQGNVDKSPSSWATLVNDAYPSFGAGYPRVAIFHGSSDGTVDPVNARELMEQWTEVKGVDRTIDRTDQELGGAAVVTREQYLDGSDSSVAVSRYSFQGMGHGIAVDPGSPLCQGKGGSSGSYAFDVNLFSSYWAARFFGILPYTAIRGPKIVDPNQQGLVFYTPSFQGSSWSWEVPAGASIVSGQGSDSIQVDWGGQAGYVKATRTDSTGCVGLPDSMAVGITSLEGKEGASGHVQLLGPNPSSRGFILKLGSGASRTVPLRLYDERGQRLSLPRAKLSPGEEFHFGGGLGSGIYHLKAGERTIRLIVP